MSTPRIYLAGPEVFLADATEIGEHKKRLCANYGFEGVYPCDADVDVDPKEPVRLTALRIGRKNEELVRSCQIIIANVTPFRGPSSDVGTVYEMGLARGLGLVVCAYTNVTATFRERTEAFLGNTARRTPGGRVEDALGMSVEDWGMADNLMIESAIEESDGIFAAGDAPAEQLYTWTGMLARCLGKLRDRREKDLRR